MLNKKKCECTLINGHKFLHTFPTSPHGSAGKLQFPEQNAQWVFP